MADKKEKAEVPLPNIIYCGKRQKLNKETGKPEIVAKEVPAFVMNGATRINLPDGIEKGVFMEPAIAASLFALRPLDFKEFVPKGDK